MRTLRGPRLVLPLALLTAGAALADPGEDPGRVVEVEVDLRADEQYEICVRLLKERRDLEARSCMEQVIEAAPGAAAAVRARAVLSALPPAREGAEVRAPDPVPFRPGHLELVLAAGSFGIWNGAAGAIALGQSPLLVPEYVSLAGGAASVALGGTFAVSTWLIANKLELSPGRAHLLSSGVAWGTGLGLSLAPWAFALAGSPWPDDALPPLDEGFERALPFALIPTVLGGYLGVGGAAMLGVLTDVDPAQVGVMNTGGWVGFALGFATTPLVATTGFGDPISLGVWYLGSTSLGLAAGIGMSQLVRLDPWEVWLTDAGALAGLVVVGGGAFLLRSGMPPGAAGDILAGGAAAGGTLVGLVGATAAVAWLRVRGGGEFSRVGWLPVDFIFAPPAPVLDKRGQLVPMLPIAAGHF